MREGRVLLVANPAAQRGNGATAGEIAYGLLVEWLGADRVDFAATEHAGHAVQIAADAAANRYGSVLALGGDGLAHEVANGLMRIERHGRPAFGLIPVGSGNDLARTLGMSECVPDAIVQLIDADLGPLDIGCCNGEHFCETLSFGLDAAIALDTVERRERTGQQGAKLYVASGIHQLLHHLDLYRFKAELDGGRALEGAVHMLAVQNGPTYGGGFRICPEAAPDDGLLDICYADGPMNVAVATFKFLSAKNARHVNMRGIHFERARTIDLRFDRRPPCQIDGEAHRADAFRISVEPHALDAYFARNAS